MAKVGASLIVRAAPARASPELNMRPPGHWLRPVISQVLIVLRVLGVSRVFEILEFESRHLGDVLAIVRGPSHKAQ